VIAVLYGFIMPVWGKVKLPIIPWLVAIPVFLNAIPQLIKAGLRIARPRS